MNQIVFDTLKSNLRDKDNDFVFKYLERNKIEIKIKPWIGCSIVRPTFIQYVVPHSLPYDLCRLISMRNTKTGDKLRTIYLEELSKYEFPLIVNNDFLNNNDVLGFVLYARLFKKEFEDILSKHFPRTYKESLCVYFGRHSK